MDSPGTPILTAICSAHQMTTQSAFGTLTPSLKRTELLMPKPYSQDTLQSLRYAWHSFSSEELHLGILRCLSYYFLNFSLLSVNFMVYSELHSYLIILLEDKLYNYLTLSWSVLNNFEFSISNALSLMLPSPPGCCVAPFARVAVWLRCGRPEAHDLGHSCKQHQQAQPHRWRTHRWGQLPLLQPVLRVHPCYWQCRQGRASLWKRCLAIGLVNLKCLNIWYLIRFALSDCCIVGLAKSEVETALLWISQGWGLPG